MSSMTLHAVCYGDVKEFAEHLTVPRDGRAGKYPRAVLATAMLQIVQELMADSHPRVREPVAELAYRCADQVAKAG